MARIFRGAQSTGSCLSRRAVATSKTSGLGATVIVDDSSSVAQTISNDLSDFQFSTPRGVQDITGVDKSAHERLLLLADYSSSMKGVFNTAANMSHAVFKTVPSTSVNRNVKIEPTSGSTPFLSCLCVLTKYDITRAAAGELTWSVEAQLADGTTPSWS
jgi:hypothetical protein